MSITRSQRFRYAVPVRSQKHTCPVCDDQVYRVPRRLIDRFLSLFAPVQRYRCLSPHCGWEGNLDRHPEPRAKPEQAARSHRA